MKTKHWMRTLLTGALVLVALSAFLAAGCSKPPKPPPECEEDADCPEGEICSGGKCVPKPYSPPPPECTSAADCPDPKICENGKCVYECEYDSDCGADQKCENHRCVAAPQCEVETVNFDFDEYYLTSDAQSALRANAECLKKKQATKILIEGHCDERGSVEYNLALGQKRAQSVKNFLSDLGIDPTGIQIISYGEERPVDSGHNEEAWAKNRRAETQIK